MFRALLVTAVLFGVASEAFAQGKSSEQPAAVDEQARQQQLTERDRLANEARVLSSEGKLEEARRNEQQALALELKLFGPDHDDVAARYLSLAELEQQAGAFAEARKWLQQSQETYTRVHHAEFYRVLRGKLWLKQQEQLEKLTAEQLARFVAGRQALLKSKQAWTDNKFADGATDVAKAAAAYKELFGEDNLGYLFCIVDLAMNQSQLAKFDEARNLLETAQQISRRLLSDADPARAGILFSLGYNYYQNADAAQALGYLREALAIQEKALGKEHAQTGVTHTQLGHVLSSLGRPSEAQSEFRIALAIAVNSYGEDHSEVGVCESNLGNFLVLQEQFVEAEYLLTSAATKMEKLQAKADRRFISLLAGKARLLAKMGRYADQVQLCERIVTTAEQVLGKDHPDYPALLMMQSEAYRDAARYDDAHRIMEEVRKWCVGHDAAQSRFYGYVLRQLAESFDNLNRFVDSDRVMDEALKQLRATEGDKGDGVVVGLKIWADRHAARGEFDKAEQRYQESLALSTGDSKLVFYQAGASSALAAMLVDLGRSPEALQRQEAAIELLKTLPNARRMQADAWRSIGAILQAIGRLSEAEQAFRRSLDGMEQLFGREHPSYAKAETWNASFLADLGRYEEAEKYARHALQIEADRHGKSHPDYAGALQAVAAICLQTGRAEEALRLQTQAIDIRRSSIGERNVTMATNLHNLGYACLELGKLAEAERHLQAAATTLAELYGKSNQKYGITLSSIGRVKLQQGQYDQADSLFQQAVDIHLAAGGEHDAHYINALSQLASVKFATDRTSAALADMDRLMQLELLNLQQIAGFSDESSLRAFEEHVRRSLRALVSIAARPETPPEARQLAADWILRRKGIVFASLCRFREQERLSARDTEARQLVERERAVRQRLAGLTLKPPAELTDEQLIKARTSLHEEADRLQADLHRRLSANRSKTNEDQPIDAAAVTAKLPADSVLVDFVRLYAYDPKAINGAKTWLPPRYYALLLKRDTTPQLVDLGPAEAIDAAIKDLRKHLIDTPKLLPISGEKFLEDEYRTLGTACHTLVWSPLAKAVGDSRRIYVSPDSELNRLALETLCDEQGKYLAEKHQFAYLTSGRELLRAPEQSGQGTAIFAGPDFDVDVAVRKEASAAEIAKLPTLAAGQVTEKRPETATRGGAWKALPGAAGEAVDLAPLLDRSAYGPVSQYVGVRAQEELFKRLRAPRILHIATHGYFVADEGESATAPVGSLTRGGLFGSAVGFSRLRTTENPLLRSGLVLAGANRIAEQVEGDVTKQTGELATVEDGWLTAEEIAMLDLRGTELVVLSACETGLGDVPIGEGVQGLRRAFLYAGCRTLVTSLYKVPDEATRPMMQAFYQRLTSGEDKLTAFSAARQSAMQKRRETTGAAHPFFWGSFILVGDPR